MLQSARHTFLQLCSGWTLVCEAWAVCWCPCCVQGSYNVTYLCEHLVTQDCLAEKPPEACVNELIDSLLGKSTQGKAGPPLAAIIVPCVVGGECCTLEQQQQEAVCGAQCSRSSGAEKLA